MIPEKLDENLPAEIKNVIETIKKYASIAKAAEGPSKDEKTASSKIKLASIKPVLRDIKDGAELVAGSELFAIIAGLFGYNLALNLGLRLPVKPKNRFYTHVYILSFIKIRQITVSYFILQSWQWVYFLFF